jgi:hypothetical protein
MPIHRCQLQAMPGVRKKPAASGKSNWCDKNDGRAKAEAKARAWREFEKKKTIAVQCDDTVFPSLHASKVAETPAAHSGVDILNSALPMSIRRPWQVFEHDLMKKTNIVVREQMLQVLSQGAQAAFMTLKEKQKLAYVEQSLQDLSAYSCWRRSRIALHSGGDDSVSLNFEKEWDDMNAVEKSKWIPLNPRAVLAADETWAPLLGGTDWLTIAAHCAWEY